MARGYHRREVSKWRHTRAYITTLLNVNRADKTAPLTPEEVMLLPGDTPPAPPMDEAEFEATMARLAEFDTLHV